APLPPPRRWRRSAPRPSRSPSARPASRPRNASTRTARCSIRRSTPSGTRRKPPRASATTSRARSRRCRARSRRVGKAGRSRRAHADCLFAKNRVGTAAYGGLCPPYKVSRRFQRLIEVADDVGLVLDADRHAHHVGAGAGLHFLLVRELFVRGRG